MSFFTNATNITAAATSTQDTPSIAELIVAMKRFSREAEAQRERRDAACKAIRDQGFTCFPLDRGMGEEWVVDDRIYHQLFNLIDDAADGYLPIAGKITGIRLIKESEWHGPVPYYENFLPKFGQQAGMKVEIFEFDERSFRFHGRFGK